MSYSLILPGPRGDTFKRRVVTAMDDVYTENVARHAPEDLGDNNTTFGVNVTHNLRFAVEQIADEIDGLEARRPRNSFQVDIDERYALYLCKAPPGVVSIRALRFDESELRVQIVEGNADQLQLDLYGTGMLPPEKQLAAEELPRHAVIVHFGAPDVGFERAEIGAPYRTASGACEWAWHEPFDLPEADSKGEADRRPREDPPHKDTGGYGLRLRRETAEEQG